MYLLGTLAVFVLGLFIIIKGGEVLVGSALSLNRVTGIGTVVIGATFVAVATTLPEVFVSIFAVTAGNHGIAVGNAIGAMIANVALVFAVSVLFLPNAICRREVVFKTAFLVGATVVVFLFALNLEISAIEGLILLGALAIFLISNALPRADSNFLRLRKLAEHPKNSNSSRSNSPVGFAPTTRRGEILSARGSAWVKIGAGFVVGQFMLCIGAFLLVENGEDLAHIFGISETVIGFTVIAVGTSLPELITAIQSIRHKSGGLAIGNVIGANVINCTLLLGVCGIIGDMRGVGLPVSRATVLVAMPVLFLMTLVAIVPVLLTKKAHRWQGCALLGMYFLYVLYLIIQQPL